MRNNNAVNSDTMYWLGRLANCTTWKSALNQHLKTGEEKPSTAAADNRTRREERSISSKPDTTHVAPQNVSIPLNVSTPLNVSNKSTLNVSIPLNVSNQR